MKKQEVKEVLKEADKPEESKPTEEVKVEAPEEVSAAPEEVKEEVTEEVTEVTEEEAKPIRTKPNFWQRLMKHFADEKEEYHAETLDLKEKEAYYKEVNAAQKGIVKEEQIETPYHLSARNLTKIYSNRAEALHDLNLDIKEGEFVVFVGPSGCGKSTTLRMIAGLEDITYGDLYINGRYSNKLSPKERGVAMVFQSYALYPHMSVYNNMAFGLSGVDKEEIDARIKEAAEILEITPYLDRKPTALSGGQCQRVALGRALVRKSNILLLDEPLSNLDAKLRVQMRSELVKLHERLKNTMIYVTHDQTEAMTMADRIVIMKKGVVQQIASPIELYNKPANTFVATFIGSPTMNIFKAHYKDGKVLFKEGESVYSYEIPANDVKEIENYFATRLEKASQELEALNNEYEYYLEIRKDKKQAYGKLPHHFDSEIEALEKEIEEANTFIQSKEVDISFGVRPEDISLSLTDKLPATLDVTELLGPEYYVHFNFAMQKGIAKIPAGVKLPSEGSRASLVFNKEKIHIFSRESGKRIF